ncbi:MAG TPA: hypothetical protein EYP21_10150 [Syntrophaceae bacterium]|nr:hypothetical protein [Syntrophaceae bacterium]
MLAVGPFALALLILIVMHFLGVPLFPYSLFGKKVRRIPHYSEDTGENLVRKWREKIIPKLEGKKMKVICGECRDCERIATALAHGLSVELILGKKIWNNASKERIVRLMEDYPEKLSIFTLAERPERHGALIGPHFLLEDPHEYNEAYKTAIVVENASEELKSIVSPITPIL